VFAGEPQPDLTPVGVDGLRLAVPLGFVLEGMDTTVAATFERALSTLSAAGARVLPVEMKVLDDIAVANAGGGFAAAEAWAWHRRLLASRGDGYDPRVKSRILRGQSMTAADYLDLLAARADIIARFDAATSAYDAVLLPTCPLIPAPIAALDTDAEYARVNMLQLRNPSIGNFLDRCAISLPCHREGEAPVGLMLMGETLGDAWLFRVAAGVEAALKGK
jgi:aspartyl-tRNA(Asn)/glutamyl-tRNA(Gln) amidotransferase subunit A